MKKMEVIKSFIEENIVDHHIKGFNHLITFGLQEIVNKEPPICDGSSSKGITFGAVHVDNPVFLDSNRQQRPMFPNLYITKKEKYTELMERKKV